MNNNFHERVKNMTRDRQACILVQSTETVVEAQAALAEAQASHARYPTSRKAFRIAEAQERVAAAKRRPNALVMAWGAAYANSIELDQILATAYYNFLNHDGEFPRGLEDVAHLARRDTILAWEIVRERRAGQRAVEMVEALRPIQSLAEWSKTPNGQEYMDLPDRTPGLMDELRAARMI